MNDAEFARIAKKARINKLTEELFYGHSFFDICNVDALGKLLEIDVEMKADYASLKNFHCVHWRDMGEELANEVKFRTKRLLGMIDVIDVSSREVKSVIDRVRGR